MNKYLYRRYSDADKFILCFNLGNHFKWPNWKFVLRFCISYPKYEIPKLKLDINDNTLRINHTKFN